ncbi:MAG TPA: malonate decarboxylase holo-ACP synthase [Steroidobacteraceae bacterium]|nr:malonate decarboxylase holo-ACP synthase [Steroidobacteraceae bacterium]
MRPEPSTHALLRIAHAEAWVTAGTVAPAALAPWARTALARAPWVVVRRARSRDGLIPVGVRGHDRAERLAAWLHPDAVLECLTPQELAARSGWRSARRRAQVPALAALEAVAALMRHHELRWGPCGSVGFELASGVATASENSDLDLVVEAHAALPRATAVALAAALAQLPVRADVLLEGPHGAVALEEYAARRAPLMLRTLDGPRIAHHPWAGPAAAA